MNEHEVTALTRLADEWHSRAASVNDQRSPTLLIDCSEELISMVEKLQLMAAKEPDMLHEGTVTIEKSKLLDALRRNYSLHESEWETAMLGYRKLLKAQLLNLLDDVAAARDVDHHIHLKKPHNHGKDYHRVIKMLEMSVANDITITELQFRNFVLDEWQWSDEFKSSTMSYR